MTTLLPVLNSLVLLCFLVHAPTASAQAKPDPGIFLNINCGFSTNISDPITGLTWNPDTNYIFGGFTSTHVPIWPDYPQLDSLRYFNDTAIPKYCYQLPVIALSTYMVRTISYYGNYDSLMTPPTFYLSIDGLIVANVSTTEESAYYYEFTYQAQQNSTFLCLLRDSTKANPFISTIELRRIIPYPALATDQLEVGYIGTTRIRLSFGDINPPRYPQDVYDRYWTAVNSTDPTTLSGTLPITPLNTTKLIVYAGGNPQYATIPETVLQSALAMSAPGSMTLTLPRLVDTSTGFLFLHFAELDPRVNFTSRVFTVTPGGGSNDVVTVNPFNQSVPDGYNATGWYWDPLSLTNLAIDEIVTLKSTSTSVFGPSINACEFFEILPQTAPSKTNADDALALENIETSLNLKDWTGDPCVPVPHTWVNCSAKYPLTIQGVNLDKFSLSGTIPVAFNELVGLTTLTLSDNNFVGLLPQLSSLKNLQVLHLQNNSLSGPLPDWLGQLPLLRQLSVQNNNFNGTIPASLVNKSGLNFTYQPGNPGLLPNGNNGANGTNGTTPIKKTNIWVIVGPVLVGVFLVLVVVILLALYCCVYKRRQPKHNLLVTTPSEEKAPAVEMGTPNAGGAQPFSVAEIAAATENFKKEIGKGGFGSVYYGELPSGQEVAVKVLDSTNSHQGAAEFFNEVDVLSRVHHKNLVRLLGFCNEEKHRMLVYEYLAQGSLRDKLNASSAQLGTLNFKTRLNIALNAAQGLEYLHTGCNPSIVHRDVKSTNILLTSTKDCAKVADFGLSRLAPGDDGSFTVVKGTRGYVDPEYVNSLYLTSKSDVFSFGVVLLELLTGHQPLLPSNSPQALHAWTLCDWVRTGLQAGDNAAVAGILDPVVKASQPNIEAVWKVADCALACVEPKSAHRPTMATVVQELRGALALENGTYAAHLQPSFAQRQHPPASDNLSGGFAAESMIWPEPR